MEQVYNEKVESRVRQEFSRLKDVCYLDHAGATLYSETQLKNVFEDLQTNVYGNPHSLNHCSKESSDLVDHIRRRVLKHFHTNSEEYSVIFTSGATAAIKLLLESFDWDAYEEEDDTFFNNDSAFFDRSKAPPGAYMYMQSNHTSVIGGREIAREKGIPFFCLQDDELKSWLTKGSVHRQAHSAFYSNSLFVYPAQCNFSGKKYPLEWVKQIQNRVLDSYGLENKNRNSKWFCLLDAATFCSTNDLNLSVVQPDFVCISFYKIFGYPTGLGALIVKNSSAHVLKKTYFGGGTVDISLPSQNFHKNRKILHERFEDGTVPFLSIVALEHGLNTFHRLNLSMGLISRHVFELAKYTVTRLKALKHWNRTQVVEIYSDTQYDEITTQGGIINFNLKRANHQYIGFIEVLHVANLRKIYIRTGCFCNSGACQKYLRLTDTDLKMYYKSGHVCGDTIDLIHGKPTGSIRVSFGYMTMQSEADKFIEMIRESFVEVTPQNFTKDARKNGNHLKLAKIQIFPIKSCGAMTVNVWKLNDKGLEYDREWMIVKRSGICLTQKLKPTLCMINPKLDLVNKTLTLTYGAEKDNAITIPIENGRCKNFVDSTMNLCESKVCNDLIQAHDCGDEIAEWLTYYLDIDDLRLVRQAGEDDRKSKSIQSENDFVKLSLTNKAQYLLINNASVSWLQDIIGPDEDIDKESFPDRFRGNFYIDGGPEFSEINWKNITIGSVQFNIVGACGRCQMICIDQKTGEKSRKPLVALSRALSGQLQFGLYLSHVKKEYGMRVTVGDDVRVQEE